MTDRRRTNTKAASEDTLGEIHSLTSELHKWRLKKMLELVKSGVDPEAVIGDGKALAAAGKWVSDNNITCAAPEEDGATGLAKDLAVIKQAQAERGALSFFDEEGTIQ